MSENKEKNIEESTDKEFDSSYLSNVYSSSKDHHKEKSTLMYNVPLVLILIIVLLLIISYFVK